MGNFGAYGKMPALGDFFRLGAEREFVTPWDLWLQSTLLAARQDLGEGFEACYMSAPIWRFSLPPGVAGTQGAVGVLMPSVDRVGRQFPLTLLAQTGYDEQAPLRNLIWQTPVLDAVEALALDALDDRMTREVLVRAAGSVGPAPDGIAKPHPDCGHLAGAGERGAGPFLCRSGAGPGGGRIAPRLRLAGHH